MGAKRTLQLHDNYVRFPPIFVFTMARWTAGSIQLPAGYSLGHVRSEDGGWDGFTTSRVHECEADNSAAR